MQFLPLVWGNPGHHVVRVTFDSQDIEHAQAIANLKLPYVNVHDPGGKVRTNDVIQSRLTAGKLADHAVAVWLRGEITNQSLPLAVVEYDAIRQNEYHLPDKYDLCLVVQGQTPAEDPEWAIEVRSSFCYKLGRTERIAEVMSIYGWYVSGNKASEPHRPYYWQFFWHLRQRHIPDTECNLNLRVFEDELERGHLTGYMVGGATASLLTSSPNAKNRTDDQAGATYRSIVPIQSGLDVPTLTDKTLKRLP